MRRRRRRALGRRLAASADAVCVDDELRTNVLRAMKRGIGDVLIWGNSWPEGIEPVGTTEAFRGRASFLAGYSDLTPAVATSLAQR
jgi:hypothetical protein